MFPLPVIINEASKSLIKLFVFLCEVIFRESVQQVLQIKNLSVVVKIEVKLAIPMTSIIIMCKSINRYLYLSSKSTLLSRLTCGKAICSMVVREVKHTAINLPGSEQ